MTDSEEPRRWRLGPLVPEHGGAEVMLVSDHEAELQRAREEHVLERRSLVDALAAESKRADALEQALGRCTCPVGFGQVRDRSCPRHGDRSPAHTVEGADSRV